MVIDTIANVEVIRFAAAARITVFILIGGRFREGDWSWALSGVNSNAFGFKVTATVRLFPWILMFNGWCILYRCGFRPSLTQFSFLARWLRKQWTFRSG